MGLSAVNGVSNNIRWLWND